MSHKSRYFRFSSLLLALLVLVATACNPSAAPTPTQAPEPTATSPAPTDTTQPPAPTDTVMSATPTEVAQPTTTTTVGLADLQWKQVGLVGKGVQDIALLPSGGNIAMAVDHEDAWRSSYDYGKWEPLGVHLNGNAASIAIGSPDVIYVTSHTGCASGGPITLARTTDGGKTWQEMNQGQVPLRVVALNAGLAYGATCGGIAKTTDSGVTWTELPASKLTNYDPGTLVATPDGEQVYAAYYSEGGTVRVMRSTDGGATWGEITPKGEEVRGPVLLFMVVATEGHPEQGGVYMASSPGLLWFLPEGTSDRKLAKSDSNKDKPDVQYEITALCVDTAYSEQYNKPGPVIYTARALGNDAQTGGMGVFRSANGGQTWEQVGKGLNKARVNGLSLAPYDASTPNMVETLLAATNDGVWSLPMSPSR